MSTVTITITIVAGLVLLVIIAYLNQLNENSKRQKTRLKADLFERYNRTADLNNQLAGQVMTPQLKLLLSRLQLHFAKQLVELDKRNPSYPSEIERLSRLVKMGENISIHNPPIAVNTEAQAQACRNQLEALHGLTTRAGQTGLLSSQEALAWEKEIRHMLVTIYMELYSAQVQKATLEQQPNQAKLALELGIQLLQKQTDSNRYRSNIEQLQQQLTHVNAQIEDKEQQASGEASELDKGITSLQDDWKKKPQYD